MSKHTHVNKQKEKTLTPLKAVLLLLLISTAISAASAEPVYSFNMGSAGNITLNSGTYYIAPDAVSALLPVNLTMPSGQTARAYDITAELSEGKTSMLRLTDRTGWTKAENSNKFASTSSTNDEITGASRNVFNITISTSSLTVGTEYTLRLVIDTAWQPSASSPWQRKGHTLTYKIKIGNPPSPTITPTVTPTSSPTPAPTHTQSGGGGGTDTGSGNYKEYPRTVTDAKGSAFGTSPIVTAVEFSASSSGLVNVNYDVAEFNGKTYSYNVIDTGTEIGLTTEIYGIKGAQTLYTTDNKNGQSFWKIFKLTSQLTGGEVIRINFKVPLADLKKDGMTYEDVILYHGDKAGYKWIPLDTYLVEIKDGYAYYYSETKGTSPFGIMFVKNMTIVKGEEPLGTETPQLTASAVPSAENTSQQATNAKSPAHAAALIIVLLAGATVRKNKK